MANPIKSILQIPWRPFKKRFDRLDKMAKNVRLILRQAENNNLILSSARRETRATLRDIELQMHQINEKLDQLSVQIDKVSATSERPAANE